MDACNEKKTLYGAFESLKAKAIMMDEIVELSKLLVAKMDRTPDEVKCNEETLNGPIKPGRPPDMIDLFNDIASRWQEQQQEVRSNLDKVVRLID